MSDDSTGWDEKWDYKVVKHIHEDPQANIKQEAANRWYEFWTNLTLLAIGLGVWRWLMPSSDLESLLRDHPTADHTVHIGPKESPLLVGKGKVDWYVNDYILFKVGHLTKSGNHYRYQGMPFQGWKSMND